MSSMENTVVELSDLVKECNLIVEVEYLESFQEEVAIKQFDANVSVPPFVKKGIVFTIQTVLKNKDAIKLPQTIQVPNEGWRRLLDKHKERYAGKAAKSYGVKEYKTEVTSMRNATLLFLHHFQGTFELEAKNSFESNEALEKITMLLKLK